MERLTMWYDGNHAICENEDCDAPNCPFADPVCDRVQNIIDRLAAYEDTGLEPEEVEKIHQDVEDGFLKSTARRYGVPVDRLHELAQADREGRCVVLPCKVGDTIYRVVHCDDGSGYAVWTIRVNFVEFNDNDSIELPNYVIGTTENGAGTTMEFSDFGKTAFTTREAAEEALKAREQDE